jgi:hypothetical protein
VRNARGHDDRLSGGEAMRVRPDRDLRRAPSSCTIASPFDSCALISSPASNANSVMLTALFCTSVRLTICPG